MWSSARCPKNFTYGCIVPFKHSTQIMWQSQSTNLASNKSWNPLHAQLQWILNSGSTKTYQKHEARAVSTTGHRREFSCCLFVGNLLEQFEALPGRELAFTYPDWLGEHMAEMQTPFILLHGTGDKVTDPDTSQKMYDVAAAKDKTIKLLGWFCQPDTLHLPGHRSSVFFPHIPSSELPTHQTLQAHSCDFRRTVFYCFDCWSLAIIGDAQIHIHGVLDW